MQTNSKSIDGIKRVVPSAAPRPIAQLQRAKPRPALAHKRNISFNLQIRKFVPYAITIIVTFFLSVATSKGIAKMNFAENVVPPSQTAAAAELAVIEQPNNPTMNEKVLARPGYIHLASEGLDLPDPIEKRRDFLYEYLKARGSVLADHVDAISEQSQWKLIVAISRAESSFCKRHALNNCWGIGGAWNLRSYSSYDEAVADVNRLLEQKYVGQGLDTPQKMVRKWVGHPSATWEAAVQQELDNLKDVQ